MVVGAIQATDHPRKLLVVIEICAGLDKLIQRAKTLEADVVMTSGKELSSGLNID